MLCTQCDSPFIISCSARKKHCFNCRFWCEICIPFRNKKKPANLKRKLQNAAKMKDASSILTALQKGTDPSFIDNWKEKFLHIAANGNNATLAQLMIDFGVNASHLDEWGWTPLYNAARANSIDAARVLIDNPPMSEINLAMRVACYNKYVKFVELLIEKGADVKYCDASVNLKELNYGNLPLLNLLLINMQYYWNKKRYTQENIYKCAKLLIDNGAIVNYSEQGYDSPFKYALVYKQYHIARILLPLIPVQETFDSLYNIENTLSTIITLAPDILTLALDLGLVIKTEYPKYKIFLHKYYASKAKSHLCLWRHFKASPLLDSDYLCYDMFKLICDELSHIEI